MPRSIVSGVLSHVGEVQLCWIIRYFFVLAVSQFLEVVPPFFIHDVVDSLHALFMTYFIALLISYYIMYFQNTNFLTFFCDLSHVFA